MNNLSIQRVQQQPALREYLKDIWIFESNGRLAEDEMRIVAPNGSVKMILHYQEGVVGRVGERNFSVQEHQLSIIGVSDSPTIADFDRTKPFGCISIEFHPHAAYRFLSIPQYELKNAILPLSELGDKKSAFLLEEKVFEAKNPVDKVAVLQAYLTGRLRQADRDMAFEYCVKRILKVRGDVSLPELEKETGYSERWLRAKFVERLGLSPKTFSSLARFQSCYQSLLKNKHIFSQEKDFYDHYYDQAHFIKEFKRFMGYSPARYSTLQNDVGESIYLV